VLPEASRVALHYTFDMASMTFDTLRFTERLRAAGVSETQAKAEVEA